MTWHGAKRSLETLGEGAGESGRHVCTYSTVAKRYVTTWSG
jgi:hypothetical protein